MAALTQDPEDPRMWLVPGGWLNGQLTGQAILIRKVHLEAECRGGVCIVHAPSDHHMRRWPLMWDDRTKVFRRLCRHGVPHTDPDSWGEQEHGPCDGCCCR